MVDALPFLEVGTEVAAEKFLAALEREVLGGEVTGFLGEGPVVERGVLAGKRGVGEAEGAGEGRGREDLAASTAGDGEAGDRAEGLGVSVEADVIGCFGWGGECG